MPAEIKEYLASIGITLKDYDSVFTDIAETPEGEKVAIHKGEVNFRISTTLPAASIVE